jgi:hypothetical protein
LIVGSDVFGGETGRIEIPSMEIKDRKARNNGEGKGLIVGVIVEMNSFDVKKLLGFD